MPPIIEIKNLYFAYNHKMILEDINFSINNQDFLAILGPNGSGKSTLLRLILGILKPQRGQIFLFGQEISKFKEWKRIGYVPQRATSRVDPVFPISVKEIVEMGLLSAKKFPRFFKKEDKKLVLQALKKVDMENYLESKISNLSGGQQQRVFIARAIVNNPDILILDEPTTGVDVLTQEKFYDMLGKLNSQGLTIVMVTHDIGVVNRHVKQVACLNRRLIYHGTHEEFCSSPKLQEIIGDHHLVIHRH